MVEHFIMRFNSLRKCLSVQILDDLQGVAGVEEGQPKCHRQFARI